MRDPKRIDRILGKLRSVWHAFPDLRLGQLLANMSSDADGFYTEDDEIESALDTAIRELKAERGARDDT